MKKNQARILQDNNKCNQLCQPLSEQMLSLDARSRRNNLKFLNMKSNQAVSTLKEECEMLIIEFCAKFGVCVEARDIERAHRIRPRNKIGQPILVRFSHFKVRQQVFEARSRMCESGITVIEDFPDEINNRRQMFSAVLKAAYHSLSPHYKAKLVVDKLLLNGKMYSTDKLDQLPEDLLPHNLATITQGNVTAFLFFSSVFSNHFACSFEVDGVTYSSLEQFFMHKKAKMFGDTATAAQVMKTNNPVAAKPLGKKVRGYQAETWKNACVTTMKTGLTAKFSQNPKLGNILRNTGTNCLLRQTQLIISGVWLCHWKTEMFLWKVIGRGKTCWGACLWNYEKLFNYLFTDYYK